MLYFFRLASHPALCDSKQYNQLRTQYNNLLPLLRKELRKEEMSAIKLVPKLSNGKYTCSYYDKNQTCEYRSNNCQCLLIDTLSQLPNNIIENFNLKMINE